VAVLSESGWETTRQERQELASLDLLAIDEAGLEMCEQGPPRIAAMLLQRHDRALVTLIATNLSGERFYERYLDSRLCSRLTGQARGGLPWWRDLSPVDLRTADSPHR
jgi:hypothetical protein